MAPSPSIFRKLLWAFTWPPGFWVPLLLAADFDFWQYLVTRSPRSQLPALHAKQSEEQISFQKNEEQTGPATGHGQDDDEH